jgi:3-hydroxybutyryl-CoA dehydratase
LSSGAETGHIAEIRLAVSRVDPALTASYSREVTTELIADFARVTGDHDPIHVDPEYAATTEFGRVIAHGALMVGFMSTASSILSETIASAVGHPNLSLGYDRVRFTAVVFAGDVVTTKIWITEVLPERLRVMCDVECRNERDQVVAVASHIMRFV